MRPGLKAVPSELPEPPYSADTKANGWKPEFDFDRINQSETWILADDEVRPWLLMLWLEAWRSVPVGSFPDNKKLIAKRIRCKPEWFEGHSEQLLRGWRLHADGNLYHDYISDMILNMLSKRKNSTERSRRYREASKNVDATRDSRVSNAQEQEQEQEKKKKRVSLRDFSPVEKLYQRIHELGGPENGIKHRNGKYTPAARNAYARVQEHGIDVALEVVGFMAGKWKGEVWSDGKKPFKEYFNASTLFAAKNFDKYREQAMMAKPQNKANSNWGVFK